VGGAFSQGGKKFAAQISLLLNFYYVIPSSPVHLIQMQGRLQPRAPNHFFNLAFSLLLFPSSCLTQSGSCQFTLELPTFQLAPANLLWKLSKCSFTQTHITHFRSVFRRCPEWKNPFKKPHFGNYSKYFFLTRDQFLQQPS